MRDTSRLSANLNDRRKLIPAIVGGVILGEALWSLIQLVLRDWAAPAIINLLGQGPTQNQNAFLLQPLLLALVGACFAGILVLLMVCSSGRSRTVRAVVGPAAGTAVISAESVPDPVAIVPPTKQAPRSEPAAASAESRSMAATSIAEPKIVPAAPAPPATEVRLEAGSSSPAASTPASIIQTAPSTVHTGPSAPPRSKKPKKIYYNIVGEPIESDD